jgi:hypothetical protein
MFTLRAGSSHGVAHAAYALDVYNQKLTGDVSKPIASRDDQDTASVIAQAAYPDPAYAISGGEQHFGTGRSNQDTFVCSSPTAVAQGFDSYNLQLTGPVGQTIKSPQGGVLESVGGVLTFEAPAIGVFKQSETLYH